MMEIDRVEHVDTCRTCRLRGESIVSREMRRRKRSFWRVAAQAKPSARAT